MTTNCWHDVFLAGSIEEKWGAQPAWRAVFRPTGNAQSPLTLERVRTGSDLSPKICQYYCLTPSLVASPDRQRRAGPGQIPLNSRAAKFRYSADRVDMRFPRLTARSTERNHFREMGQGALQRYFVPQYKYSSCNPAKAPNQTFLCTAHNKRLHKPATTTRLDCAAQ